MTEKICHPSLSLKIYCTSQKIFLLKLCHYYRFGRSHVIINIWKIFCQKSAFEECSQPFVTILKIGKTHKRQKGHVNFSNIKVIRSFKLGEFPSFPCTCFRDSLSSLLRCTILWTQTISLVSNFHYQVRKKKTH